MSLKTICSIKSSFGNPCLKTGTSTENSLPEEQPEVQLKQLEQPLLGELVLQQHLQNYNCLSCNYCYLFLLGQKLFAICRLLTLFYALYFNRSSSKHLPSSSLEIILNQKYAVFVSFFDVKEKRKLIIFCILIWTVVHGYENKKSYLS